MIEKRADRIRFSEELTYLIYKKESRRLVDFFLINVFKNQEIIATSTGNSFSDRYQEACFDFVVESIKEDSKNERFDWQHIVDITLKEDREYQQRAMHSIRFDSYDRAFLSLNCWFTSFQEPSDFNRYTSRIQNFSDNDFSFKNKEGQHVFIPHEYQVSITPYFNEERKLEMDKIKAEKYENKIIDCFENILESFCLIYSLSKDKVKFIADEVYSNHKQHSTKDKRNDLYEFYSQPLSIMLLESRLSEIAFIK